MNTYPAYKVAAAHVAPVFLDLEATASATVEAGADEKLFLEIMG